ncbi:unnamed protein product [Lactuca saligna]|uniref:Stomatal closure-related actin-binding protein Ig domain-containing protein n=1 Tax=Lactuca saligna TaxID=75948 RepID=A0AA36ELM6_LACSI|nr:unnamed protein product [Lactuca saligna]
MGTQLSTNHFGATKPIYAPEPSDVGRLVEAEVISDRLSITLTTSGPIVLALGNYVEALAKCRETGEIVAIKKVLQDKHYNNRELQVMQMLDHPNVVALKHSFFSTTEKEELCHNLVLDFVT